MVLKNKKGDIINLRGTNLGSWLSMEAWIGPLGKAALGRSNWVVNRAADHQSIKIDLVSPTVFDEIVLEYKANIPDNAAYLVQVSADGAKWDTVRKSAVQLNRNVYSLDAKLLRYIKIDNQNKAGIKGGEDSLKGIAEIYAYMDDDFSVRNAMIERFGEKQTDQLFDDYQKIWITTDDLNRIARMGMNMVRVPVYWMELMDNRGEMKRNAFSQLDWITRECSKRNMYIIIDLHGAPGGLDAYITSGQAVTNDIWQQEKWQSWTIRLWEAVAMHFKGNPAVAAYDLLNEPVSNNKDFPTRTLYDRLYKAVRAKDPDHLISMGAFNIFDFIGSPVSNGWTNVIYQAHYYNTDISNKSSQEGFMQVALKDMETHQQQWNVPVYAGEYNFWQYTDIWQKWMEGLNRLNASWSNWTYKNRVKEPANWGFYQINASPIPDMSFDSIATIREKWSKFSTGNFKANDAFIAVVNSQTRVPAVDNSPKNTHP